MQLMKIIGIGIGSKYLLFPFIMPIFWFLKNYIGSFIRDYSDGSQHQMKHHPIILSFLTIFGDIIAGSLNIFIYFRQKPSKIPPPLVNSMQSFTKVENLPSDDPYIVATAKELFFIFIASILEVTMHSGFFILSYYSNSLFGFTMNISLIIFEAIISVPILKYKMHKHQIVSLILILIGFILVCIPQIITGIESNKREDSLIFYPIYFAMYIIFAVLDVTQKWVMENKLYTPYKLVLIQGLFSNGIFSLLFLILPFCKCKWEFCNYDPSRPIMIEPFISTFELLFSNDVRMRILIFIAYELVSSVYVMLLFLTIYHFTPTQRSVSDSLASFINWIRLVIMSNDFSVMPLIGYLLVLFSCLIYNEIIILYFFGLADNTKAEIDQRALFDSLMTIDENFDFPTYEKKENTDNIKSL